MHPYLQIPNYIVQVWTGHGWMTADPRPMRAESAKSVRRFLTGGDSDLRVRVLFVGVER